jgi:putative membrane protein
MANPSMMSEADHVRVSEAVAQAEMGTAGEIVTIITQRSDRYQDVALWWSALFSLMALAALALFPAFYLSIFSWVSDGWITEISVVEAFELAFAVAGLKFLGSRLILQYMPLRLWMTPKAVKATRVRTRAIRYFKVGAERRTQGRTGILIYLSTDEHRAEIVADEAIHAVVPDERWGDAMAKLIGSAREGRMADGMVAAIGDVGAILAEHFPRADDDVNELPDRLIEL